MEFEKFKSYLESNFFKVLVKVNRPKFLIKEFDTERKLFKIDIDERPENGRANIRIKKWFKKNYKLNLKIVSGKTSKEKLIKIIE